MVIEAGRSVLEKSWMQWCRRLSPRMCARKVSRLRIERVSVCYNHLIFALSLSISGLSLCILNLFFHLLAWPWGDSLIVLRSGACCILVRHRSTDFYLHLEALLSLKQRKYCYSWCSDSFTMHLSFHPLRNCVSNWKHHCLISLI